MKDNPRIVIIGAGFAGLWAVRELNRKKVRVTLIDRNNYHTFLPLLYQVAAAELKPEDITYPIRGLVRDKLNTEFLMDCVKKVDLEAQKVYTTRSTIPYDYLIIAPGTATDFFGVPGASEHALSLKTVEEGVSIRNRLLSGFEQAAHEIDPRRRKGLLTFVVIGGGPTGIEYAGALAELVSGPMAKDYPEIGREEVSIIVVEMMDRLLGMFPEKVGNYAKRRLERMGVKVLLGTAVSKIESDAIMLKDGSRINTSTVVWTAGVRGVSEAADMGLPAGRGGLLNVRPTLQVASHDNVYAVGDIVLFEVAGKPLPMVAQVAVQQAKTAARNILRQIGGGTPETFVYRDRGAMVTIGRNAAAAYVRGMVFTGFIAWVLWLGVHIFNLIGIPNRLFVLLGWALDYFFSERTVRLILPGEDNCIKK
jgi:NADH dehydrogenase